MNTIAIADIANSFFGSLLALLFAGLAWLIKSAYEKNGRTSLAIAKFERSYVENTAKLDQHIELIKTWVLAIENKQKYSAPPFSFLATDDKSHFSLGDMELVNLIIKTNFRQKNLNDDLGGMYSFYDKNFLYFLDEKISPEQWHSNNEDILPILKRMLEELPKIQNDLIQVIARLRLSGQMLSYSIFGCINLLYVNIWPTITREKIKKEVEKVERERMLEIKQ